ncbi:MAG: metal ABC transporter permease [Candidatus Acetothermia bacterium]|jgi:ABC-type Mn2+/Zn2+ transport system permease subunit|nr:metal ABC transporter permease [Candidatus Acetothermia bacterium]
MWGLILPSLVGSVLAGGLSGLLGVCALRLQLSSVGFAMAHAAFAGAALALLVPVPPVVLSLLFALAVAALLGPAAEYTRLPAEVVLGVAFPLTMALGFVFLALAPGEAMASPALSLLWGSLLGVGWRDVALLAGVLGGSALFIGLFRREVLSVLLERRLAEEAGVPARPYLWLILFLIAAAVAVSLKLVGGMLVYSLLMLPASAASQLVWDMKKLLVLSPILGALFALGGLGVSLALDLPAGASIALVAATGFALATVFSPKRRRPNPTPN